LHKLALTQGENNLNPKNLVPIALLLLSMTCAILPPSRAQQTPTLSIEPSTTHLSSTQIGSIITVNLTVNNAQNVYGWSLNLTWDPKIINLKDIKEGPFLSSAGKTLFTWAQSLSEDARAQGRIPGSVVDVLLKKPGVDGSGVLAILSFQVLNSGVSSLSLDGSQLAIPTPDGPAQNITPNVSNGYMTIDNSFQSSTPTTPTNLSPNPSIPEFTPLAIPILCISVTAIIIVFAKKRKQSGERVSSETQYFSRY
jgi:hypothetical protein